MKPVALVFPHQIFEDVSYFEKCEKVFLIEEYLFFRQYPFHKQKLASHRASMKFYEDYLKKKGIKVEYIQSLDSLSDIRNLIPYIKNSGYDSLLFVDVSDDWLRKRIVNSCHQNNLSFTEFESPMFLNSKEEIKKFFSNKKIFRQTDFYAWQRKKLNLLLDDYGKPLGGKWSFDDENRLRYPKNKKPPNVKFPSINTYYSEAFDYVNKNFQANYGKLNPNWIYPITFDEAKKWFNDFLKQRFKDFGPYEDAILSDESILNHSLISPLINVGLLTPNYILNETLKYSSENNIPLNSLEGFIRQIIGWREFIRAVYELWGGYQRTLNFWNFSRKIPESFWNGTTGIEPLDIIIKRVLETGYCHHIERLMVLGSFMLLCEFDPDEVYRWFMTLFIDAYDWVMVPNIYGMSQFADGGLMSTKPYISGSNYLMKMSDFKKGDWQRIWDSLFWSFLNVHRDFFTQNPRLGMLVRSYDNFNSSKKEEIIKISESFLSSL
ncbi:MAG: cryptochrome/photolyase family protein [Candidatus Kapabacteria bacterium]|nr:cryptochrome/photolyase family protein [Candidatus Kapabacteria bacterium]